MRLRPLSLSSLLAAATIIVAASPLAAQTASPAPPGQAAVPATHWDARPLGKYHLELDLPDQVMQAELTVSDSAGTLQGLFWPDGDNDGHMMTAEVRDTALVFRADSPRGPVQLTLRRADDRITGEWKMGADHGLLRGKKES